MFVPTRPSTYIVIPVHNRRSTTLSCLQNLRQNGDLARYQVVVIDDGSTDGTGEAIAAEYPEAIVLPGNGQLWWTGTIALGMRYAYDRGGEFFVWLNDDCQPEPGTIADLVQICQQDSLSIVGCQGVAKEQPQEIRFGGKIKTWRGYLLRVVEAGQLAPCDLLCGNLVCMSRTVVERVGYPDAIATPHYHGDSLFSIRAQKAGCKLLLDTRHLVYDCGAKGSRLYPGSPRLWLLYPGGIWALVKLATLPQSGLNWRVRLRVRWEAYRWWGICLWSYDILLIATISLLRVLPKAQREKLVELKLKLKSQPD